MTMRRGIWLAMLLASVGASAAAAATDPFANPVKDCRPCHFSVGSGGPAFDLTFVFEGSGDDRNLAAFEIAPADGGQVQRLDAGGVAVSQFPGGFSIMLRDLDGDGALDLGLLTLQSADGNASANYWLYDPKAHQFAELEIADDCVLQRQPNGALLCHVKSSAAEYVDTWYRIEGHRAVAQRKAEQRIEDSLLVQVDTDLTAKPPKSAKTVVGFMGDSPERATFRKQLDTAAKLAAARYKSGDKRGAVAALAPVLDGKNLWGLTDTTPVGTDTADLRLIDHINDYGFYLAEVGRPDDAIPVLQAVIDLNRDRTVTYLNLADAQFAIGDKMAAKQSYAEYVKRMAAEGKEAHVPARATERMR